ncbi:MAG: hypothetical protein J0H62_09870 [Rhizobiales bacterium]|nr:hypothetical protein [Hyphomicrobiales bacterium]
MSHRFRLGQKVVLTAWHPPQAAASGTYEIVRLMPALDGESQYRIKNVREQHERVAKESQLERA